MLTEEFGWIFIYFFHWFCEIIEEQACSLYYVIYSMIKGRSTLRKYPRCYVLWCVQTANPTYTHVSFRMCICAYKCEFHIKFILCTLIVNSVDIIWYAHLLAHTIILSLACLLARSFGCPPRLTSILFLLLLFCARRKKTRLHTSESTVDFCFST